MKSYYRVMLGKQSIHAATCFAGGFIGVDDDFHRDLAPFLTDEWKPFNAKLVPVFLGLYPGKSKIAAGLACGVDWTVCKGILKGDIVLCPDGMGKCDALSDRNTATYKRWKNEIPYDMNSNFSVATACKFDASANYQKDEQRTICEFNLVKNILGI